MNKVHLFDLCFVCEIIHDGELRLSHVIVLPQMWRKRNELAPVKNADGQRPCCRHRRHEVIANAACCRSNGRGRSRRIDVGHVSYIHRSSLSHSLSSLPLKFIYQTPHAAAMEDPGERRAQDPQNLREQLRPVNSRRDTPSNQDSYPRLAISSTTGARDVFHASGVLYTSFL
jgi:hypothetical protein